MEKKIRQLIKEAMIEKNKNKQITYKSILENAQKIAKKTNRAVTDEDIITAIKNEIKQLNDLMGYVLPTDSGRISEITEKVNYCTEVLPKQATKEDIMDFLTGANLEKNIGVCMKVLKEKFGVNMDGKMANAVVRDYIAGK